MAAWVGSSAATTATAQAQTTNLPLALPAGLAQAVSAADMARALALAQQAAEGLAPAQASVSTRLGTVDPRLKPAPCSEAEAFLPQGMRPWGSTRVGLRCTQGTVRWTLYIPLDIQVHAPALTLKTSLPAGKVLDEADLVFSTVEWSAQHQAPMADLSLALGRALVRPATAGAALRAADLKQRRWFTAGDRVKVVSGGPGFTVATEGLALNDGLEGQRVRVQLLNSGSSAQRGPIVQGQAVGARRVELLL